MSATIVVDNITSKGTLLYNYIFKNIKIVIFQSRIKRYGTLLVTTTSLTLMSISSLAVKIVIQRIDDYVRHKIELQIVQENYIKEVFFLQNHVLLYTINILILENMLVQVKRDGSLNI